MGKPSVVILGGGFAGLEAAFALRRRLRDAVDLTIVSDRESFLYRPNTIHIPFGADPSRFEMPLADPAARKGIRLRKDLVLGVDPGPQRVRLEGGSLPYDFLVIATGAATRPEEIPGLREHADTLWSPKGMLRLRSSVERIVRLGQDGVITEVVFLVPPESKWTSPLYEMVLMLETHLRRKRARGAIRLVLATAEPGYVQALGPKLDRVVREEFLARGIEGHQRHVVSAVEPGLIRFDPVSMCVIDELDKATFAQVPLELTGCLVRPIGRWLDREHQYRVGVSPAWRLGKRALGTYLSSRFRAGDPARAGAGWAVMDAGLRGIARMMAN